MRLRVGKHWFELWLVVEQTTRHYLSQCRSVLIVPLSTNFWKVWLKIENFSEKKIHLNISDVKFRPFWLRPQCVVTELCTLFLMSRIFSTLLYSECNPLLHSALLAFQCFHTLSKDKMRHGLKLVNTFRYMHCKQQSPALLMSTTHNLTRIRTIVAGICQAVVSMCGIGFMSRRFLISDPHSRRSCINEVLRLSDQLFLIPNCTSIDLVPQGSLVVVLLRLYKDFC